ncbi:unnamed protein product, partial [Didymodactylos carnosus]
LVNREVELSITDIVALPSQTIPVTLVCAGNRRKEQNMYRQTIGFNWGSAAVSTSMWKGVLLKDILTLVVGGIKSQARWVCFEGVEQLPNGTYGTSIPIGHALNEQMDVMIAYEMNGERLPPDHGYPVRMIIPGCIGGRMVKWLKKIEVTETESSSYLHYHDNRVLPAHVIDADIAENERWWYKPDYIIMNLNINSVITSPHHNELLTIKQPDDTYTLQGYAYTGGNRKVIRVEVSFDEGLTFELTNIKHPELDCESNTNDLYFRPRYWCWVFWSFPVETRRLIHCQELIVRAWDSAQNSQPQSLTWNIMGMMNNCYFSVKISRIDNETLKFEHPTVPGNNTGDGWLKKQFQEQKTTKTVTTGTKFFTMNEVSTHNTNQDCWIIIDNKVYNPTPFLSEHPGGGDSITLNGGTDCSDEFNAIHSKKAHQMLEKYYIGDLLSSQVPINNTPCTSSSITQWQSVTLEEKVSLSKDHRQLKFRLQNPEVSLGLSAGNHILLKAKIDKKTIIRAYTPSSPPNRIGSFDLAIKVYGSKNGGIFSRYLDTLQQGDKIDIRGPLGGNFVYQGAGKYLADFGKKKGFAKEIGMVCAGTGITPMFQIIQYIYNEDNNNQRPFVSLIYGSQTKYNILLHKELQSMVNDRLRIRYVLSRDGERRRINKDEIKSNLFPFNNTDITNDEKVILLCGSEQMIHDTFRPILSEIFDDTWIDDHVFVF